MTPTETCRSRSQELRRANVCKGSLSTPSPRHWSHTGTMPRGPRYHVPYLFRAWQSHCSLGDTRPLGRGERTPFPARGPSGTWSQGVLWLFPLVPNQPSAKNTQVSPVTQRQKCYSTCLQQKRACLLFRQNRTPLLVFKHCLNNRCSSFYCKMGWNVKRRGNWPQHCLEESILLPPSPKSAFFPRDRQPSAAVVGSFGLHIQMNS